MDVNKDTLRITNVYVPCTENREVKKELIQKLSGNQKRIMLGDWNIEKSELVNELNEKGIHNWVRETRAPGSRIVQEGLETNRIIDYSVANYEDAIEKELYLRDWQLSDHLPVECLINFKKKQYESDKEMLVFDREKCKNNKVKKNILNRKYKCLEIENPQDMATACCNLLKLQSAY